MRVAKSTQTLLRSPTFVASDGETPAGCASPPTATVSREDGTALTAATVAAVTAGAGIYDATITTAHTSQIDRLLVTWTGTVTGAGQQVYVQVLDVVSGHYVTLADLRSDPDLSDPTRIPKALLEQLRDEFAEIVEAYCRCAFVRRYERERVAGTGSDSVLLTWKRPRSVLSVKVDGVAQTVGDFDPDPDGILWWQGGTFGPPAGTVHLNVAVAYEHGYDAPPEALGRAARTWVRRKAVAKTARTPNDQLSETVDGVTVRFSTPDPRNGRPTGMLDVDGAINAIWPKLPGIA